MELFLYVVGALFFGLVVAVSHKMNNRFVERPFDDLKRKLQAVRQAQLDVHDADRKRMASGPSDPAAQEEFEQACAALRRAQETAEADRFPFRHKSADPSKSD